MVKPLLDETIRKNCNDVGGTWVEVMPPDEPFIYDGILINGTKGRREWNEHSAKYRTGDFLPEIIWACRIPAVIVEKAADAVKAERKSRNRNPPCVYFHGKHKHLWRKDMEEMDFRRLGFPENTKDFNVCDIPYNGVREKWKEGYDENYTLMSEIALKAINGEYLKFKQDSPPQHEEVYDNYNPHFPDTLLEVDEHKGHRGVGKTNVHYHINYEGSQERLYKAIREKIIYLLDDEKNQPLNHKNDEEIENETPVEYRLPPKETRGERKIDIISQRFIVTEKVNGTQKGIFTAEIGPAEINAVPRITITKINDDFDELIYAAVEATKIKGQMVGRKPLWLE